jgi:hypothetical protein
MKHLLLMIFILTGPQADLKIYQKNGINMELSRIQKILAGTENRTTGKKNFPHPVPKAKSLLADPDKLFNSGAGKVAINPLPNLNFSGMNSSGTGLINENSRVLHIGDSHTVGIYGHKMDELMRSTGAKVFTLASSGSSPSSWINGFVTHSGFYYHDETGNDKTPSDWVKMTPAIAEKLKNNKIKDWQVPVKTPDLKDMINKFHPNVIVFSLGANLAGYAKDIEALEDKYNTETNPVQIKQLAKSISDKKNYISNDVRKVCEIAKSTGAKIVWIGPPDGRSDVKPPRVQEELYEDLRKVAAEYGSFIDSRPFTDIPDGVGGDGVHYWNPAGKHIDASGKPFDLEENARTWAKNVFDEIQK